MKKLSVAILAAVLLACPLAGNALADKVDFGALKCEDFLKLDSDTTTYFYFWLDGYASSESGDTNLDTSKVKENMEALIKYCTDNPKKAVLSIIEE